MREIKFRAWDNVENKFHYPGTNYDMVFLLSENTIEAQRVFTEELCTPEGDRGYFGDYETLEHLVYQQYTGLTDKNGVEIYEGDILKNELHAVINLYSGEEKKKHTTKIFSVIWDESGCWSSHLIHETVERFKISKGVFRPEKYSEIIGNIHENPELLEDE